MKIALFGGTFDPVHLGHLAVARRAVEECGLDLVYFVPADLPPHKRSRTLAEFSHRFAMLALATAQEKRFVPSLLESGAGQPNYSIQTVRRMKSMLRKSDKLYFLIGIDAFMEISTWRHPVELLAECDFIVASRPGHTLDDVNQALPESLRPSAAGSVIQEGPAAGTIHLPSITIHLLNDVQQNISSTQIRAAAHKPARHLGRYVPKLVAAYIRKERLYAASAPHREKTGGRAGKVLSFRRGRSAGE